MNEAELIKIYPVLYHMAERGSWDNIQEHGLWSTSGLLDLYGVESEERRLIEERHRRESVTITSDGYPNAVIRDQKPMSDGALEKCLRDGLQPADWYRLLNGKVFFWATRERLIRLLGGRAYRNKSHDVLTVDTARLIEAHRELMTLCPYNSGSTIFSPVPRGLDTFQSIEGYPFEDWKRKRGRDAVVEVAVETGVPKIAETVLRVENMRESEVIEIIWQS